MHYICRPLSIIAWIITGLYALNAGLKQLGWFDLLNTNFLMAHASTVHYIIGLSGAVSLIILVLSFMHRDACCDSDGCCDSDDTCPRCGKCPCTCK